MFPILIVRAFALVSFEAAPVAPWATSELAPIVYAAGVHSAKGRQPWATESLNPSGALPSVAVKGAL